MLQISDFSPSLICTNEAAVMGTDRWHQGRTDNSWGPPAIGDHGPLCPCPNSKKSL
ncbi:unnamed protein product [Staurois parvus]|uniref:Uncharacterized protein n=1 Tax=Staurois parvus TaxID=386267 RepID=A0ABN9BFH7_9NEOB|nr:unnamed protein product [Staurois parvus]